jgi:hypothetical protein
MQWQRVVGIALGNVCGVCVGVHEKNSQAQLEIPLGSMIT